VFYLPPPPRPERPGRGRPKVRGRKLTLKDGRTLPTPDQQERVEQANGGWYEIAQWNDVRMKAWPGQRLVLYRVWEYKANGKPRYKRPLWLIYVGSAQAPTPSQAQALYGQRFGVEHLIRFLKGDLGLDSGQFNGARAIDRVALWVELVATAMWLLFALRGCVTAQQGQWPAWWRSRKATPGAVRRLALGILISLGIQRPKPKPRGKSPGRALGAKMEPRRRYKVFRKRKRQGKSRAAA